MFKGIVRGLHREAPCRFIFSRDMARPMPVRSTIHSLVVSTILLISALVMIRFGKAEPTPSITVSTLHYSLRHLRAGSILWRSLRQRLRRSFDQAIAHHFNCHVNGGGKTQFIGAAMAFHHNAVEAGKYAAIVLPGDPCGHARH